MGGQGAQQPQQTPQPQPKSGPTPTPGGGGSNKAGLKDASYAEGAAAQSPGAQPGYDQQAAAQAPPGGPAAGPGDQVDARIAAIESAALAGDLKVSGDPLDLEGNQWRFRFADPAMHDALLYLISDWAGVKDTESMLVQNFGEDPKWVAAVRYEVLKAAQKPAEKNRTAAVAKAMCDKVEKHGPIRGLDDPRLSKIYKDVHEQASKRMGTSRAIPLSQAEKDKGRVDLFESKATADGRVANNGGTSCGLLPGTCMKNAGIMPNIKDVKGKPANLTGAAVGGMRDEAEKIGAWHVAAKTDVPPPGAPYMLSSDSAGKAVEHVGVISQTDIPDPTHGLVWKTLDAGQGGDGFAAEPVTRKVERRADGVWLINTLPGQLGDPSKWRKLVGWVDLDKLMAAQEAQIAASQKGAPKQQAKA